MSKEQGAESALWAEKSESVGERREEVHGRYFSEAEGKVRSSPTSFLWTACPSRLNGYGG